MSRVLVVYKKSSYEFYSKSPDKQVRNFSTSDNQYSKMLLKAHSENQEAIRTVTGVLERLGVDYDLEYRCGIIGEKDYDLIISLGGDGTALDISHAGFKVPILGVNSSPDSSRGFLCHCNYLDFEKEFSNLKALPSTIVNRLKVYLNEEPIAEQALNDLLYAHVNPAAMTKYRLKDTIIKSSGLLISTAVGSTAFIYQEGGEPMPVESSKIEYLHRAKRNTGFDVVDSIEFESLTRESSLWVDGEHIVYPITLGDVVRVESGEPAEFIGDIQRKQDEFVG